MGGYELAAFSVLMAVVAVGLISTSRIVSNFQKQKSRQEEDHPNCRGIYRVCHEPGHVEFEHDVEEQYCFCADGKPDGEEGSVEDLLYCVAYADGANERSEGDDGEDLRKDGG